MIGGYAIRSSKLRISTCCKVQQSIFRIAVERTGDSGTSSFWHPVIQTWHLKQKKKTPITGLRGPEGSGQLRLQITRHSAHEGGKVVILMHRPPLPPGISWYSFLEAESEMSAATE